MDKRKFRFNKKKWLIVCGLALLHLSLLAVLFPLVGERSNLVIFIGPLTVTWLYSWRIGVPLALLNAIVTAVVFSTVGRQGPDGRSMGVVFLLIASALCFGLDYLKRFIAKGKAMADELENLRRR